MFIIKIPKKGAFSNWSNRRGITLLSVPSNIFYKIIIDRIALVVDRLLGTNNLVFEGQRCTNYNQIFVLRNIIEKCSEWQRPGYVKTVCYQPYV